MLSFVVLVITCVAGVRILAAPAVPSNSHGLSILEPTYVDISNYSYTVAVTMGLDLLGGGVLVSQRWVLTAASVTHGVNTTSLRVRLGSNSAYSGGKLHKVKQVIEHPLYSGNDSYNLAMVQMDRNVSYSTARHIAFLARTPFSWDRTRGNITGYGEDSLGESHSYRASEGVGLQLAQTVMYSSASCSRLYDIGVPDTQLCAVARDFAVPCYGDVGDPLTVCVSPTRCKLVGIYTGYNLCGEDYGPQTYMDIGLFRDWVKSVLWAYREWDWEEGLSVSEEGKSAEEEEGGPESAEEDESE